jgi:hypothetical protein
VAVAVAHSIFLDDTVRSITCQVRECLHHAVGFMETYILVIASAAVFAIIVRLLHGKLDHQRIRQYIEAEEGRLIEVQWLPFSPDWFRQWRDHVYVVRYVAKDGGRHVARCGTSGWSGVRLADDRVVQSAGGVDGSWPFVEEEMRAARACRRVAFWCFKLPFAAAFVVGAWVLFSSEGVFGMVVAIVVGATGGLTILAIRNADQLVAAIIAVGGSLVGVILTGLVLPPVLLNAGSISTCVTDLVVLALGAILGAVFFSWAAKR